MYTKFQTSPMSGTGQKVYCSGGGWVLLTVTLVFIFGPNIKTKILTLTQAQAEQLPRKQDMQPSPAGWRNCILQVDPEECHIRALQPALYSV